MEELREIRRRKLEDLRKQDQIAQEQDFITQHLESAKKTVLQRFLTKEARERLSNVKAARPELAQQVETALFDAAQAGAIQSQITEDQLKEILNRATSEKKDFRIIK